MDQYSRNCIIDIVPALCLWEVAQLKVVGVTALEGLLRVVPWISEIPEQPRTTLELLAIQNPTLETTS